MEILKTITEQDAILIIQIVKFGEDTGHCLCCDEKIPPKSVGLVTIVSEGFPWCYACGRERLSHRPELQEVMDNAR